MSRTSIATTLVGLSIAFAGLGCADETTGPKPAEFDELCGVEGPVQLLALDPDPGYRLARTDVFGERYVISLRREDEDEQDDGVEETEIWSVGMCGEDPLLLSDAAESFVITLEPWPEELLICDRSGEQLWIYDPTGVRAPAPVFDAGGCEFVVSPEGLLTIEGGDDSGALVFQPWPDDPWSAPAEQLELHGDVSRTGAPHSLPWLIHEVVQVRDDEVFALTGDDELVVISRVDGTVELLAESVLTFEPSPSGRYVLWQDLEVTGGSEDHYPHGQVSILDRETGATTALAETSLGYTLDSFVVEDLGLLYLRLAAWSEPEAATYLELPAMTPVVGFGPELAPRWLLDDSRVLVSGFFARSIHVVDIASGQATALYDGPAVSLRYADAGLTVLDGEGQPLRFISYAGDEELLAREASRGFEIGPDGRVFTPYAVVGEVGELVVVDPVTLDPLAIDEQVFARYSLRVHADAAGESIATYLVVDPARYGIWAANPRG